MYTDEDNVGDVEENFTQQCISSPSPGGAAAAAALSCLEDMSGREDEDCIDCVLYEPCSRSGSLLETGIQSGHDIGSNTVSDIQGNISYNNTLPLICFKHTHYHMH